MIMAATEPPGRKTGKASLVITRYDHRSSATRRADLTYTRAELHSTAPESTVVRRPWWSAEGMAAHYVVLNVRRITTLPWK